MPPPQHPPTMSSSFLPAAELLGPECQIRIITLAADPLLPDGEYAFIDSYCTDPECDCGKAMIDVYHEQELVSVVNFGWEKPQYYVDWLRSTPDDPMAREMSGLSIDFSSPDLVSREGMLKLCKRLMDDTWISRIKQNSGICPNPTTRSGCPRKSAATHPARAAAGKNTNRAVCVDGSPSSTRLLKKPSCSSPHFTATSSGAHRNSRSMRTQEIHSGASPSNGQTQHPSGKLGTPRAHGSHEPYVARPGSPVTGETPEWHGMKPFSDADSRREFLDRPFANRDGRMGRARERRGQGVISLQSVVPA